MKMKFLPWAALVLGTALLSGCSVPDWMGETPDPPIPGERISILTLEDKLKADPVIADLAVRLPRPYVNEDWPQSNGHTGWRTGHCVCTYKAGRS